MDRDPVRAALGGGEDAALALDRAVLVTVAAAGHFGRVGTVGNVGHFGPDPVGGFVGPLRVELVLIPVEDYTGVR